MLTDPEQKIARPRQIYVGYPERPYKSKLSEKTPHVPKMQRR
jgi:citrate synthase